MDVSSLKNVFTKFNIYFYLYINKFKAVVSKPKLYRCNISEKLPVPKTAATIH